MNCWVVPRAIDGLVGVTSIEVSAAAVTVSGVEAWIPLTESVAVIVEDPMAVLVARPLLPRALLTGATAIFEELQVTELVRFCVELSV